MHHIFASLLFKSRKRVLMKLGKQFFPLKALFVLEKIKVQNFRYSNFMMSSNA